MAKVEQKVFLQCQYCDEAVYRNHSGAGTMMCPECFRMSLELGCYNQYKYYNEYQKILDLRKLDFTFEKIGAYLNMKTHTVQAIHARYKNFPRWK